MEFIREIQEHGIYVSNSIKALAKFSQSEGVPKWPEKVVDESFATSVQFRRSLNSLAQQDTAYQLQTYLQTPGAYS